MPEDNFSPTTPYNPLPEAISEEFTAPEATSEEKIAKEDVKQEIAQQVEHAHELGTNIDELYKNRSINELQELKEPDAFAEPIFENILEESVEKNEFEPKTTKDERFLKILKIKNAQTSLSKLLITAYYLSEFEKTDKFSLKLINAKLMQNLAEVIDHSTLQEGLDDGLIEVVPDLTGIAETTEYRLSEKGEDSFLNGFRQ